MSFWRLFRSVLLERIVNPVFVGGALEGLDISVGHFNVADGGILSHEMLYGLLAPVGLGLRGGFLSLLNFLHELLESFVQNLSSDFAALDGDSNNFGIFIAENRTVSQKVLIFLCNRKIEKVA